MPFTLHCCTPWGDIHNEADTGSRANVVNDILVDTRVLATAGRLTACTWLAPGYSRPGLRNATRWPLAAAWFLHWLRLVIYTRNKKDLWLTTERKRTCDYYYVLPVSRSNISFVLFIGLIQRDYGYEWDRWSSTTCIYVWLSAPISTHTQTRSIHPLTLHLTVRNTAICTPSRHRHCPWIIIRQLQPMPSCGRLHQPIGTSTARDQLLAVAHRDIHVACQTVADLTRYLDLQSAHLAACAGAGNDSPPLITVETFPRLPGGVCAVLDSLLWYDHRPHISVYVSPDSSQGVLWHYQNRALLVL